MSAENLTTYLNDHLAGSVAALDLLDHLRDSARDEDERAFFENLRADIAADQDVLRGLLARHGGGESSVRKAAGWIAEKFGWAKLKLDGPADAAIGRLQALEGLALGITGKRALWQALAAARGAIEGADLAELTRRAEEQRDRVEARRIEAARAALG